VDNGTVQPDDEDIWTMFHGELEAAFTNTMRHEQATLNLISMSMKGNDLDMYIVTIYRDSSHACVHLAVLCICDVRALYAPDQSAVMVQEHVPIYGSSCILCVRHALRGCATLYYTHGVVVYVCV
jgi:hypothetical protein